MQLEGSARRKRSSSKSDGDIENSRDYKKFRFDDGSTEGVENLTVDERHPLAEIAVGQAFDYSDDGDDTEWLETRNEELELESSDDEANRPRTIEGEMNEKDLKQEGNVSHSPRVFLEQENESYSMTESSGRNVFRSRRFFMSNVEFMNFFKRKGRTGSEQRTDSIFDGSPALRPNMRSILLDWIIEVCDVYGLYRETYHLTVDYLDRYLCNSGNIPKNQLQLIGVTALLIAAKCEEIYPPKISDFSFITDGACTDEDIIGMEERMVQVLEWRFSVITSDSWMLGFLQLLCVHEDHENSDLSIPRYNHLIYQTIAHLLDLCSLDCGFIKYPYKVLALSSIYSVVPNPDPIILKVSGYSFEDLSNCLNWMEPFWTVLCQRFDYKPVRCEALKNDGLKSTTTDFLHMRMKHKKDREVYEAVQEVIEIEEENNGIADLLPTPPSSSEKQK